ncbi:hypothetical protein MPTK1_8g07800 [Marchantia polymorpha subsp. ruderalis]|nr:hypothetical protein MARPO_0013s0015 [Marchantia polymorpha]BBN19090.1 hypothetical protein Mp_8g07800 [Marchantia polymorpha subsp. ruderalis]|eukprot:PTQ45756.1 hypothetical protein MARPO_0013s0015 [Marchantia polymorpha]
MMSEQQYLLPGIPDRITIEGILTRAPWKTLCTLCAVNRAWRHAIQSRRVYDARTCTKSSRTLVVLIHNNPSAAAPRDRSGSGASDSSATGRGGVGPKNPVPAHWRFAVSLYDPDDGSWIKLPSIPGITSGVPKFCGCAFLDGKLYILGGDDFDRVYSTREAHMIDLAAGRGVWERCASMECPRSQFCCAVNNGRIYVFGGGCRPQIDYSRDAEVFDPEKNTWRSIADMMHSRTNHTVLNLEGRLLVIGGAVWLEAEDEINFQKSGGDELFEHCFNPTFAEVYDPRKNKWRTVENITKREKDDAFVVVHGKMFVLRPDSVHVYDVAYNSWTFVQPISWETQLRNGAKDCSVRAAAYVGRELVAVVGRCAEEDYGIILLKSKNFRRKNALMTWEPIASPYVFDTDHHPILSIQL